jgi:hypothetical protein
MKTKRRKTPEALFQKVWVVKQAQLRQDLALRVAAAFIFRSQRSYWIDNQLTENAMPAVGLTVPETGGSWNRVAGRWDDHLERAVPLDTPAQQKTFHKGIGKRAVCWWPSPIGPDFMHLRMALRVMVFFGVANLAIGFGITPNTF